MLQQSFTCCEPVTKTEFCIPRPIKTQFMSRAPLGMINYFHPYYKSPYSGLYPLCGLDLLLHESYSTLRLRQHHNNDLLVVNLSQKHRVLLHLHTKAYHKTLHEQSFFKYDELLSSFPKALHSLSKFPYLFHMDHLNCECFPFTVKTHSLNLFSIQLRAWYGLIVRVVSLLRLRSAFT